MARKYRVQPEALPEVLDDEPGPARAPGPPVRSRKPWPGKRPWPGRPSWPKPRRLSAARRPRWLPSCRRRSPRRCSPWPWPGVVSRFALRPVREGAASGLESVEFLVTANASQPLRPMAKVASGGELSRIGLAIQVITSRNAAAPTLIFDEVDVGIGGRVAEIVGRLLRQLGRGPAGAVRHPPAAGGGPGQLAVVHRQGNPGWRDPVAGHAARRRRRGSRRSPGCWAA